MEEKIEETESTTSDDDEDESDSDSSIQVVQRDVVAKQQEKSLAKYNENPQEEESLTDILPIKDTNTTQAKAKYDAFFEDLIGDSGEIPSENRDENKVLIPTLVPIEKNSGYSKGQDKMTVVFEDATKTYTHDVKTEEDSSINEEDDWRSAENSQFGEKKYSNEAANEDTSDEEFSAEDYMDKKIDVKGRMETRPERRPHYHSRPMNVPQYGQHEDHGILGKTFILV